MGDSVYTCLLYNMLRKIATSNRQSISAFFCNCNMVSGVQCALYSKFRGFARVSAHILEARSSPGPGASTFVLAHSLVTAKALDAKTKQVYAGARH